MGEISSRLVLDRSPFNEGLRQAREDAARFSATKAEAKATVSTFAAKRDLRDLEAELARIGAEHPDVQVRVEAEKARAELHQLRQDIRDVSLGKIAISAELNTAAFTAKAELLKAKIAELDRKTIHVNVDQGGAGNIGALSGSLDQVGQMARQAESSLNSFGQGASGAGGNASGLGTVVSGGAAAIGGLIIVVTAAAAALAALAGSFAFAVGGAGALATAMVGALGPALLLVLGVAQRIQAVMQARQAQQAAQASATRGNAAASNQHAAAMEREYQAAMGLRNAEQGLTTARRAYAQAVVQAGQQITQAFRAEHDAARAVTDAEIALSRAGQAVKAARQQAAQAIAAANRTAQDSYKALLQAAQDADRAIKQASEDQSRATIGVTEAQLNLKDANDAVAVAQKNVNDIQSGAVAGDLAQAQEALTRAQDAAATAALDLTDAQQRLVDSQKQVNDFATQGRNAYPPYTAAVLANAQAQKDLHTLEQQGIERNPQVLSALDSQRLARESLARAQRAEEDADRKLALVRREGIAQNPQVVAAAEALRNAHQQVTQAQHAVAQAAKTQQTAIAAGGSAASLAADKVRKLSAEERDFLKVIGMVTTTFRQVLQPATDAVLKGIGQAARILAPVFRSLQPLFTQLGQTFGGVIVQIARALRDLRPEFAILIRSTSVLVGLGGKVFVDLLKILTRLAVAAMPLLIKGMQAVVKLFDSWEQGTRNATGLSGVVALLVSHLSSWLNLGIQVAKIFLNFFIVAAPFGKELVDWLAKGAQQLANWISSAKGTAAIQSFFRDVIPLVKQMIIFVARLVPIFLQLFQAAAPIMTAILKAFNAILPVINSVLTALRPVIQIMGQAFAGSVDIVIGVFKDLGKVISAVGAGFKWIWDHILNPVFTWIINAVKDVAKWFSDKFGAIWGFVKGVFDKIAGLAKSVFGGIISGAGKLLSALSGGTNEWAKNATAQVLAHTHATKTAFGGMIDTINGAIATIPGAAKAALGHLRGVTSNAVQSVKSVIDGVDWKATGRSIIANIATGIYAGLGLAIGAVNSVIQSMRNRLPGSEPKDASSPLYGLSRAGRAVIGNIVMGIRAAAPDVFAAMDAVMAPAATVTAPAMRGTPLFGADAAVSKAPHIVKQALLVRLVGDQFKGLMTAVAAIGSGAASPALAGAAAMDASTATIPTQVASPTITPASELLAKGPRTHPFGTPGTGEMHSGKRPIVAGNLNLNIQAPAGHYPDGRVMVAHISNAVRNLGG